RSHAVAGPGHWPGEPRSGSSRPSSRRHWSRSETGTWSLTVTRPGTACRARVVKVSIWLSAHAVVEFAILVGQDAVERLEWRINVVARVEEGAVRPGRDESRIAHVGSGQNRNLRHRRLIIRLSGSSAGSNEQRPEHRDGRFHSDSFPGVNHWG